MYPGGEENGFLVTTAKDAYDAMKQAKEDVPYLKEHPSFIGYCVNEEVKKISDLMASGIPMGH